MNIRELKTKHFKITVLIITLMLIIMSIHATKSVAENTESTKNTTTAVEMQTTASSDDTIELTKVWDDSGNEANRPQNVTYKLYKDGDRNNVIATLTLNNTNAVNDYTWKGTFENIPQKDSNNQEITYIVCEENVANYISIADKTVSTTNSSEIDTSAGIKFKFNSNTKMSAEGRYLTMFDDNAAMKFYAYDVKNDQWYGLDRNEYYNNYEENGYIFKDSRIRNTLYELRIENMTSLNSAPTLNPMLDTGNINEMIGLNFPETKHQIAVGDCTVFKYKGSPKSSIEWYFNIDLPSWGAGWGMKIDDIQTTGKSNCFVSTYNRQDISFTKIFEDEGFENLREDTEMYLYGNNVRKDTITLKTSNNKNQKEWQGVFKNQPIYDSNWKKIDYRIEEKKNNNYTTYYDSEDYNGLAIKFSKDSFLEDSVHFALYYKTDSGYYSAHHKYTGSWQRTGEADNCAIQDATIYIPSKEFIIRAKGSIRNLDSNILKIESIKPVANVERIGSDTESVGELGSEYYKTMSNNIKEHTGNDYFNFDSNRAFEYYDYLTNQIDIKWSYKYSDTQSIKTNKIINKINKLNVIKKWDDNGSKNTRPQSIKIDISNINSPDVILKTVELTAEDEDKQDGNVWKKCVTGVPEYDENGYKIKYIYKEQVLDNYETTYDTSKKLTGIEITMEKGTNMYDFVNNVSILSFITKVPYANIEYYYGLRLYDHPDGLSNKIIVPIKDTEGVVYDKNDPKIAFYVSESSVERSYKIESLRPVYEDEYTYSPSESDLFNGAQIADYTRYSSEEIPKNGGIVLNNSGYYIYRMNYNEPFSESNIISNKEIYASVPVKKIWNDANNQDNKRPSEVTVNLFADGRQVKSQKIKASDSWEYTFKQLPIYNDQNERIVYTITEDAIDEYTTEIDGYTITNTYIPLSMNIKGTKIWDDEENQDGLRPEKVKIYLYADGTQIATTEVSKETNWSYEFNNLPQFRDGGVKIVYTVDEEDIEGYETKEIDGFNIINKHEPEKISISGKKTWNHGQNSKDKQPTKIVVNLYDGDKKVKSVEVTEEDDWKYSFENLPKYKNEGEEIKYSVIEDEIKNYKSEVNGFDITNTFVEEEKVEPKPVQTGDVIIKIVIGILITAVIGLVLTRVEVRRK